MNLLQTIVHYSLHLLFPAFVAYYLDKKNWLKIYLILLSTMLVDLDHLWANPIFDPLRCSIGTHFLHSSFAICIYIIAFFFRKTRIIALGLLLHMLTDALDCAWTNGFVWQ